MLLCKSQYLKKDYETAESSFKYVLDEFTPNNLFNKDKSKKTLIKDKKKTSEDKKKAEKKAKEAAKKKAQDKIKAREKAKKQAYYEKLKNPSSSRNCNGINYLLHKNWYEHHFHCWSPRYYSGFL